jgi:hypothetical protein
VEQNHTHDSTSFRRGRAQALRTLADRFWNLAPRAPLPDDWRSTLDSSGAPDSNETPAPGLIGP